MVNIKNTVGDKGVNAWEDVALVQLMLRVIKNARGQSYFASDYNGTYNAALKTAISSFQTDQRVLTPDPYHHVGTADWTRLTPPGGDKSGLIGPRSRTFDALNAKLPVEYKDIRTINNIKLIYLGETQAQAMLMALSIRNYAQFNPDFREKIARLVEIMFQEHGIVLRMEPKTGWRRDFASQIVVSNKSKSGPGESAHQFGRGADVGFQGLKWVMGNGQIKTADYWLQLPFPGDKMSKFFEERNKIAVRLGLFYLPPSYELIHLQNYNNSSLNWGRSLARLLETTSPTRARWTVKGGIPNHYNVDLGLGGFISVGTSTEMWNGVSPINKAEVVRALNAKRAATPTFSVEQFFGGTAIPNLPHNPQPAATNPNPPRTPVLTEANITAANIQYLQNVVRAEIQAADRGWDQWTAVQ